MRREASAAEASNPTRRQDNGSPMLSAETARLPARKRASPSSRRRTLSNLLRGKNMKIESRKIIIAIWMLILSSFTGYAQSADDWKDLETEYYKFAVPASWLQFEKDPGDNPEQYFEASGKFLPLTYNQSPVIVTIYIVKMKAGSLKEAKKNIVQDYRKGAGREFPKGFSHDEKTLTLKSGEKAYLVNTRFYQKGKGLNQSRFDLVAYSPKAKSAYLYTMTVQYSDAEYQFEKKYKLKEAAQNLYEWFQLKGKA